MRKLRKMAIGVLSILLVTVSMGSTVTATVEKERKLVKPMAMIAIGEKIEGNLTDENRSRQRNAFNTFYYFSNNGECGKNVSISLKSDAFDTYMFLYRQVGKKTTYLGGNDDESASTFNSEFKVDIKIGEMMLIEVTSYHTGETGAFTLEVKDSSCPVLQSITADLFLTDLTISPKVPAVGQMVTFTAKLNVNGTVPENQKEEIFFDFYMNDPVEENKMHNTEGSLKKGWKDGDIVVKTIRAESDWKTGDNFISAYIGEHNRVDEIDYSNNWLHTGKKLFAVDPSNELKLTTEINNRDLFVTGDEISTKNILEYSGLDDRWVHVGFIADNSNGQRVHLGWDRRLRFIMNDENPYEEKFGKIDVSSLEEGLWKLTTRASLSAIPDQVFYIYKLDSSLWNWWNQQ